MRAKSEYPATHGDQHAVDGSDPIPGFEPFVEGPAIWGAIVHDGGGGSITIANGSLNATTTLVQHNTILEESGVTCDIVSTPSRIVIETAGLYALQSVLIDVDGGAGDYGLCAGSGLNATGAVWSPISVVRRTPGGFVILNGVLFLNLDIGDYLTQVVGQDSGSGKSFTYLASLYVARFTGPVTEPLGTIDGGSP